MTRTQPLRLTTWDQQRAVRAYRAAPPPPDVTSPPLVALGQGQAERHTDGAGLLDMVLYIATTLGAALMVVLIIGLLFLVWLAIVD